MSDKPKRKNEEVVGDAFAMARTAISMSGGNTEVAQAALFNAFVILMDKNAPYGKEDEAIASFVAFNSEQLLKLANGFAPLSAAGRAAARAAMLNGLDGGVQ